MTSWEKYKDLINSPLSNYAQAEMIAYHRAMEIIKQKTQEVFYNWIRDVVEWTNRINGHAKYRDVAPHLISLQDYGLVAFQYKGKRATYDDFDLCENWHNVYVTLTPKGYLTEPEEWFKDKEILQTPEEEMKESFKVKENHVEDKLVDEDFLSELMKL